LGRNLKAKKREKRTVLPRRGKRMASWKSNGRGGKGAWNNRGSKGQLEVE